MAQFVFVEARRLISFLAVRARATCCMQLLSGQRSLPQSIFVPFAVGVAVAFTSLASSASFATFKSAAARPLLGAEFYIQTCVCTSMCKYICTARMSVCITPTSATIILEHFCVFFFCFSGLFYFVAKPKFYFTHLARSPFVLNKFVLTSLVFLDKTYSYQAVSMPHTHPYICIHSCCLGPR